jgi:hypothetical protein
MDFQADRLVFEPFVPEVYSGTLQLKNFKYRNSILDIQISGFGNGIASFDLDGKKVSQTAINGSLKGKHTIIITMNRKMGKSTFNLVNNIVSPKFPDLKIENNQLKWDEVEDVIKYKIYLNGKFYQETKSNTFDLLMERRKGEFQVMSVNINGTESFLSKPVYYFPEHEIVKIEAEQFDKISEQKSAGYSGNGFVEFSLKDPKTFSFEISPPASGEYLLEFRYANGSGPVNTDNKCGIRAMYCNGVYTGAAVFPQRGTDEWSNWGISCPIRIKLKKGVNQLELKNEPFTQNMNGEVNQFFLDQIIIIKGK